MSIAQVRLVSLMTQDARAAQHFVSETLGSLATASPILQKSLRVFLECGSNATEAAELLHSHRNTLLRRLEKAEELLPRPLRKCRLDVAAALEVLAWTQNEE
ncbi:helix-turn-helix domain-containing protein [Paraburkholderia megapolitana]|uniref:helix-turn-helix domain-containing protein n=1 Tax=Paraburkholderia megapolitana TaxID=420953 RepID=UPI001FE40A7F|nr:helix-turn-helix domain-containing protein [Paraburkholderia megapolitana]